MAKKYIVTVNGTSYEVVVEDADPNASYTKAPETPMWTTFLPTEV